MDQNRIDSLKKNIFHLFYSTILSRVLQASLLIILANYLESENYGVFSVILALTMVMGFFTDVGLSNTVLREGSKPGEDIPSLFSSYIKLKFGLLIVTILISNVILYYFYPNREIIQTANFLLIPMIVGMTLQTLSITYFQLEERMHVVGLIRILTAIFQLILVLLGMLFSWSLPFISLAYGVSYLLGGIYGLTMLKKELKRNRFFHFQRKLLKGLTSFIISGLIILLLPQLGPLILEKTVSFHELGIFSVAYRIPSALYQIPGIIAGAFFPILFKYYNANQLAEHLKLNILQLKVMSLLGMLITIPLYHMSNLIVELLLGEKWLSVEMPLKILSLLLVFQSISFPLADGLTSKGLQARRTYIQILTVILGGILYYFLSLQFHIKGAVYTAIIIEIFSIVGFWALNPCRLIIALKFLLPYSVFFIGSLTVVNHLFASFPILAAIIHLSLLFSIIWLDGELRDKVQTFLNQHMKWKKRAEYGREKF
nr:oligosaccharide flippase family protein [Neobacillus sp. Marseille-Q6967]